MSNIQRLDQVVDVDVEKYRPLVFFGINIDQDDDNIIEYVKWCKRQGFGGFNIIVGSDWEGRANQQWTDKLLHAYGVALKTAKEEGLEVWIFDDWGYPSGTAGGLVCTNPDYRLKRLDIIHDSSLEKGETISVKVPDRYVSAGFLPAKGEYQSLKLVAGDQLNFTPEESGRLVIVGWNYSPHQAKSNCKSYPGDPAMSCIDLFNPEATRKFLEVMHQMYYDRFEDYMGDVVKGFFYDEPILPYEFPWTEKLPETFKEKKGYDLLEILPELLVKIHSPRGSIVKYSNDFFDVWTDMAADNFYGEMSKWCEEHGLELSGHMDLDHHLNTMSTISGHFYKNMQYNHRPAIDVIWAQIAPGEFKDFPRYAGSVKYLLGRERATTETFAGMGLGLSGDLMRFITDHEMIRGINDFHLMYSSNKPPAHEKSPQMPNHMLQADFGPEIYERMATSTAIGSIGEAASNIAVYIPAYDFNQAQLGLRRTGITNAEKLPWEWVDNIAKHLTYAPYDFCYIWQEALLELEVKQGGLSTKGGQLIDTIIIPPGTTMDDHVIEKLQMFINQGGKVISVFKPVWPLMDDAIMCNEIRDLDLHLDKAVQLKTDGKISLRIQELPGKTIYMLLNEEKIARTGKLTFTKPGNVFQVNLTDLSLKPLPKQDELELEFDPIQLQVFLVDHEASFIVKPEFDLLTDLAITPENWQVTLPDGEVKELPGVNFPTWEDLGIPTYSGSLVYTADFDLECSGPVSISVDQLFSHAIIEIDGQVVGKMAYRPYQIMVHDLEAGKHKLTVKVFNTEANTITGTLAVEKELYHGRFALLANYDRRRLTSGLLQPLTIIPCEKLAE